ncbi:DVU_1557 family redox protein [Geotalea toluenoxydans]|uniref:DVU_1557 family redox protein n=1 Tax=Geotalea toluenoxydans TaxID=421624 RepID=UPI001FB39393|nr:CLJU_RS11820 family redox protein [Geotalea toluenoxydans]
MDKILDILLLLDPAMEALLSERGIGEDDIRPVVLHAEGNGVYLEHGNGHRLACFTPAHVTFWVEYLPKGNGYRIFRAYTHRMKILQGFNMASGKESPPIGWSCSPCGLPLELAAVKLTYLGETFVVDLPACPSCQRVLVSEENAVTRMALAEQMLEDK